MNAQSRLRIVPPRQQLPGCCYCAPVEGVTEYGWQVTRFVRCGASIGTAPCPRCDGTLCLAHVAAHRKLCGGTS